MLTFIENNIIFSLFISYDEFRRAVRKDAKLTAALLPENDLRWLFSQVDVDNGGTVEVEEFVKWLNGETTTPKEKIKKEKEKEEKEKKKKKKVKEKKKKKKKKQGQDDDELNARSSGTSSVAVDVPPIHLSILSPGKKVVSCNIVSLLLAVS